MTETPSGLVVKRCCAKAAAAGVAPDTPLPLAQALAPSAQVYKFDIRKDLKALYKLAYWTSNFSPLVGLENELIAAVKAGKLNQIFSQSYGIILDIAGTERLFGGHLALAQQIFKQLFRWHVAATIAVAPTIGAAWALSRYSTAPVTVINNSNLVHSLAALPPAALRINSSTEQLLSDLGITTIEQILKLPRKQLNSRFGHELLIRLDQALGNRLETFRALKLPIRYRASRHYEFPLKKKEQIQKLLLELIEEVLGQLKQAKKRARNFKLTLQGNAISGETITVTKTLQLTFASNNSKHLFAVLTPVVESLRAPEGFFRFFVEATQISTVVQREPALFSQHLNTANGPETDSEIEVSEFINLLNNRLGASNVTQAHFAESHLPEQSFLHQPFSQVSKKTTQPPPTLNQIVKSRPSYLFKPPYPIKAVALLPDQPPAQLQLEKTILRITVGFGPERIQTAWWQKALIESNAANFQRDYFTVQDQFGRWLWVFRDLTNLNWYLHGIWF